MPKRHKKPKALLLVYGSGGHEEQMRRLLQSVKPQLADDIRLAAIHEPGARLLDGLDCHFEVPPLRTKKHHWYGPFMPPAATASQTTCNRVKMALPSTPGKCSRYLML